MPPNSLILAYSLVYLSFFASNSHLIPLKTGFFKKLERHCDSPWLGGGKFIYVYKRIYLTVIKYPIIEPII